MQIVEYAQFLQLAGQGRHTLLTEIVPLGQFSTQPITELLVLLTVVAAKKYGAAHLRQILEFVVL